MPPGGEDNGCQKKSHHCHTPDSSVLDRQADKHTEQDQEGWKGRRDQGDKSHLHNCPRLVKKGLHSPL